MSAPTLLVVAKAPVAGLAKTRLAATIGDVAAARIAAAALLDTLEVATDLGWPLVIAMTGDIGRAEYGNEIAEAIARHRVVDQRGQGFAERLVHAHAAADAGHGVVQVGMDTPQLQVVDLRVAGEALETHGAALGMATDGGWWALAVRTHGLARALLDVPMSTEETGTLTRVALGRDGTSVARLATMTDVDVWADALAVAQLAPKTRFAIELSKSIVLMEVS
ncbi:MAG: DUF2064 domain-containing protein [Propionibacteriales bacterium]|nr:DUF2064 domain-containing protein [Propionibacteriales bacterium]